MYRRGSISASGRVVSYDEPSAAPCTPVVRAIVINRLDKQVGTPRYLVLHGIKAPIQRVVWVGVARRINQAAWLDITIW